MIMAFSLLRLCIGSCMLEPTEEVLSRLGGLERDKRIKEVWITPELPFIMYLTAGFFTAAFYDDFIFVLLS